MMKTTRPPPRILYVSNWAPATNAHYLRVIAEAGLSVAEARSEHAVSKTLTFQPDIIVLDFEFDGEVVAALQASEETKNIPVIALAKLKHAAG